MIESRFTPMLACSDIPKLTDINYPVLASIKLDGIRCIAINGKAYSRTLKLVPNKFVQAYFERNKLDGLDGELMVKGDFNSVQSAFMSQDGQPDFEYCVFDITERPDLPFRTRQELLAKQVRTDNNCRVRMLSQKLIRDAEDMRMLLDNAIDDGHEGIIVRAVSGPYKYGRSTMKQGYMLKLKPFEDSEAVILAVHELMHNDDTSTKCKDNMIPGNTFGAFTVQWKDKKFKLGGGRGCTAEMRAKYWAERYKLIGKTVTFKYQGTSAYGIPRFPTIKGIRYE